MGGKALRCKGRCEVGVRRSRRQGGEKKKCWVRPVSQEEVGRCPERGGAGMVEQERWECWGGLGRSKARLRCVDVLPELS